MKEIFTPIIVWKNGVKYDYTGTYEVSDFGTIKSLAKIDKLGHKREEKIMRPFTNSKGYNLIQLTNKNGREHFSISHIVWESFNGQIPEEMQVNHINENKTDNRLDNLNLMTAKDNNNWGTRKERAGEKISKARTGKRYPKGGKPVLQYDLNGNFIKRWECADYAEDDLHKKNCQANISACCRGKIKTAYGYKWKFVDNHA